MHQNEAEGPGIARITSIFEISAPKLTKVTYSHKFPARVTIPPPPSPPELLADITVSIMLFPDKGPVRVYIEFIFHTIVPVHRCLCICVFVGL
jgi:hypothetical protein